MKYGKYDLHKSSTNPPVGTSYSWYYRKCDNVFFTAQKTKLLKRSTSDSTIFSDYTNQICLFEKEILRYKKCRKLVSDVGKNNCVKNNSRNIKPVRMQPFTGNFFYGKSLPGYEYIAKTEEKITYLPDSDAVTASEDMTVESLTTPAPTIVDAPEMVTNPIFGCLDTDIQSTEYFTSSVTSKDSQLNSSTCTELRNTMNIDNDSKDMLYNILKDYKRIMKEWNYTVNDHCSGVSHNIQCKKRSTIYRESNTDSYVRSLHSTFSCRNSNRCFQPSTSYDYNFPYTQKSQRSRYDERKTKSLNRNQMFNNWTSTLQNLKKKTKFWKVNHSLTRTDCKCLEAIYEDYDRRLQNWCETISHCTSLLNSVHRH